MLVGAHAEVLNGLTSVPLATEENGVRTGWRSESKLVKREDLTASVEDALLRAASEAEGDNAQLRYSLQADVVGDSADDDNRFRLSIRSAFSLFDNLGERDGRAVDLRLEETFQDDLEQAL